MVNSMPFFYLTLAAAVFFIATSLSGRRRAAGRGARSRVASRRRASAPKRGAKSDRPGLWSLNTVFLFLAGFGIGGFFAATALCAIGATVAIASTTGVALVALDYGLLRFLHDRQHSSARRIDDYVGLLATVTITILAGGVGRVCCRHHGETTMLSAKSEGVDLPVNSLVRITSVTGAIAIVEAAADCTEPAWKGFSS